MSEGEIKYRKLPYPGNNPEQGTVMTNMGERYFDGIGFWTKRGSLPEYDVKFYFEVTDAKNNYSIDPEEIIELKKQLDINQKRGDNGLELVKKLRAEVSLFKFYQERMKSLLITIVNRYIYFNKETQKEFRNDVSDLLKEMDKTYSDKGVINNSIKTDEAAAEKYVTHEIKRIGYTYSVDCMNAFIAGCIHKTNALLREIINEELCPTCGYHKKSYPNFCSNPFHLSEDESQIARRLKQEDNHGKYSPINLMDWVGKYYPNVISKDGKAIWNPAFLHHDFGIDLTSEQLCKIYLEKNNL